MRETLAISSITSPKFQIWQQVKFVCDSKFLTGTIIGIEYATVQSVEAGLYEKEGWRYWIQPHDLRLLKFNSAYTLNSEEELELLSE